MLSDLELKIIIVCRDRRLTLTSMIESVCYKNEQIWAKDVTKTIDILLAKGLIGRDQKGLFYNEESKQASYKKTSIGGNILPFSKNP